MSETLEGMVRTARLGRICTAGFAVSFGVQVAAERYTGSFVADESVLDVALFLCGIVIDLAAIILMIAWMYRGIRGRSVPADGLLFLACIIGAQLLWRFVIHDLPGNGFKLVAVIVFFVQPVTAGLGTASVAYLFRRLAAERLPAAVID